jgi:hypothetical protein
LNLFWPVVALVVLIALFVALAVGARSAVGRHYDMEEAKLASPLQQSLALREQVVDNGRGSGRLVWVLGGVLGVLALVAVMYVGAPFLKEARLGYKAVRPSNSRGRGRPAATGALPTPPHAPRVPLLPASAPEEGLYEDVDAPVQPVERVERVERWSGYGR